MRDFIQEISIQNFKSIKELHLEGCSRINVFIGEPNVGKSNILEALTLASLPNTELSGDAKLDKMVRYEQSPDFHYGGNIDNEILITITSRNREQIRLFKKENRAFEYSYPSQAGIFSLPKESVAPQKDYPIFMLKYHYSPSQHRNYFSEILQAPNGENLPYVLNRNKVLMKEVQNLFAKNNQKLVIDKGTNSLKIMNLKQPDEYYLYLLPYHSVADTLQRLIFYKAAVISNQKAILLFEEPEACMFPPYISKLTTDIIQSTENQFFITTHSPVVITDFLENARNDLSIFITYFEDEQTKVRKLTKEELHEVAQYGIDLFYNYEAFAKV